MAAKYLRKQTWWIRFYHPLTRALIRESLGTPDEARAKLLRQRIELEAELLHLRFQMAEVPTNVRLALNLSTDNLTAKPSTPSEPPLPTPAPAALPAKKSRVRLDQAFQSYFTSVQTDNATRHVENKLSMRRRFLGSLRAEQFATDKDPVARERRLKKAPAPFFTGEFLDEMTPALLQDFFTQLDVATKTKRHYREFFHHFFEHCLKFGLFQPENFHCPNPVAVLPSYLSRNRRIVFMDEAQVEAELRALEPYPAIRIAVAIMIYAGLRRAETLWLTRDAIAPDLSFLSVINRVDQETDIESSLKTGERAVTILPPLKRLLEEYLPKLRGQWLIHSSTGRRWHGDAFGKRLRSIHKDAGQAWTCLHYRHTYATQRAAEGWPLFRIAKELGNSVAVVEEYYAGFIRPASSSSESCSVTT